MELYDQLDIFVICFFFSFFYFYFFLFFSFFQRKADLQKSTVRDCWRLYLTTELLKLSHKYQTRSMHTTLKQIWVIL